MSIDRKPQPGSGRDWSAEVSPDDIGGLEHNAVSIHDLIATGGKQINLHAEAAEAAAHRECTALEVDLPHSREYATMSAYLFPHATADRLMATVLLSNILFYLDDVFAWLRTSPMKHRTEALRSYRGCVGLFRGQGTPYAGDLLGAAFHRLRTVMLQMAPAATLERLAGSLEEHLAATLAPKAAIMTGGQVDVDRYIQIRGHDCGMAVVIDLIEFSEGRYLDDSLWADPMIAALRDKVIGIGGLMNDVFSYAKEVREGQSFNLVRVLREHGACDDTTALRRAITMVNRISQQFLADLEHPALLALLKAAPDLRWYVRGLRDQANASFHWQMDTNRYRSAQSPFAELRAPLS